MGSRTDAVLISPALAGRLFHFVMIKPTHYDDDRRSHRAEERKNSRRRRDASIAEAFGLRGDTVRLWRSDFVRGGIEALKTSPAP
jgi:hypothetical protein